MIVKVWEFNLTITTDMQNFKPRQVRRNICVYVIFTLNAFHNHTINYNTFKQRNFAWV